ncbi:MAG: hypothetical protein PHN56_04550 [Candidatus Nanoarchaeia archaeon]|nr:hypothetical protein [Candidatus Nanoarchaeia archaeon]
MASFISSIDNIVKGLIVTSSPETFPEYGSVIFFLLFFVIFSITFASTAFIPVFKGEDKMNNIRAVISFSVAFLSSIFYFDLLTQSLLFFGVWMVLSFFSSFAVIAVVPKEKRKDVSMKVIIVCLVACLIVTLIAFFGDINFFTNQLESIALFFSRN